MTLKSIFVNVYDQELFDRSSAKLLGIF